MSFVDILAPDLLVALAAGEADPACDPVRRTLARADLQPAAWRGDDVEIAALFGLADAPGGVPALAALTASWDLGRDEASSQLCRADPVHLRADPSRLILFDAASLALEAEEADALIAHLNSAFAGQGVRVERGRSPLRWYAAVEGLTVTHTASPRDLRGLAVESCLEDIRTSGAVSRVLTEMQMVLFDAPVNREREAAGKLPVNSVWLWGLGPRPDVSRPRISAIVSDDDTALACGHACGLPAFPIVGGLANAAHETTGALGLACPPFTAPAAVAAFGREILRPALELLHNRRVARVRVLTRTTTFDLGRLARWMFWRRPTRLSLQANAAGTRP